MRQPRLTWVSDGKPRRRLLLGVKGIEFFVVIGVLWHDCALLKVKVIVIIA
jgi:hypothetical protein